MGTLFRKMLRELFNNRGQTILTLLALTVGIIAFGAVVVCYNLIARDLPQMHKVTNGHSLVIKADEITNEMLAVIDASEHVSVYEPSAHIKLRVRGENQQSHNMDLFAYNNPSDVKINQYNLVDGKLCNTGEIMFERLCLDVADVSLGDTIILSNSKGAESKLKLVGSVHDISQHPASYHREVYGYVSVETLRQIGFEPNQILILVSGDAYDRENVTYRKQQILAELESAGIRINDALIPEFLGTSPHSHEYVPITMMIQIVGIIMYILATMLIINLLSTILSKQTKQIGIIKTIGGEKINLFVVYIAMVVSISVFCLVLAGPLSISAGKFLTSFLLGLGNYELINPSIPVPTLIMILCASFFVPLVFSFFPILRSCNITINEALNSHGISSGVRANSMQNTILKWVGVFPIQLRKAVRNIIIYRRRVISSIILLTLGGTAYICSHITIDSLEHTVDKAMDSYHYDYEVMLSENDSNSAIRNIMTSASGISIYEEWKTIDASIIDSDQVRSDMVRFQLPPDNSKIYKPMISEGRWFAVGDINKIVLSSHRINGNKSYRLGDRIDIMIDGSIRNCEVIGFVREVGFQNNYVQADSNTYQKAAAVYKIKFDSRAGERISAGIKGLEDIINRENLTIQYSLSVKDFIQSFHENSLNILMFFSNASLFMIIVSGIGLASTMSIQIMGRTKEIGVLQSIGSSREQIFRMIVLETGAIGVFSFVLTLCLSIPISYLLNSVLGVTLFGVELYMMMSGNYFIMFAIYIAVIIGLASLAPAQIASKTLVKNALAYE